MNIFNRVKKKDRIFSDYPCSAHLHNALYFIQSGKPDAAYEEICWGLLKSGEPLTDAEMALLGAVLKNNSE
ncbi:MAG: hypothetical protein J6B01_04825 [Ruminococcus sp.]|nr:hypothetical protein [Ruminococcus sp.]MBO5319116.1 hypothetical protein [Ruminococcus sp.]